MSRVGSSAQIKAFKQVAATLKGEYAQYKELAAFAQFGSDLDARTKAIIDKGDRLAEIMKQPNNAPMGAGAEIAVLWALKNGFFDSVEVARVSDAKAALESFFSARKPELLAEILRKGAFDGDLDAKMKSACEEWKKTFA